LQAAPRQKNPTSADEYQKLDAIVLKLLKNIEMNINNKFTKQNVWESDAINLFHKFTQMEKHMSYSFAGQAIETVTKIFSIRVDSLYDDVIRINAVFGLNGKNHFQP
jgi:Condensin complex subunit 2